MTKTTTPLFSFNAQGTIDKSITFRGSRNGTVVEKKPELVDPRTLAQWYHRGDYLDSISLWHQLTPAQKWTYESNARRYHITGYNLFLKETLPDLAHLALRYHLDEGLGITTQDTVNSLYPATLYGPTWQPGYFSNCLSFDGIDDYTQAPNHPSLNITNNLTMEYWMNPVGTGQTFQSPLSKGLHASQSYATYHAVGNQDISFMLAVGGGLRTGGWGPAIPINQWTHVTITFKDGIVTAYKNGIQIGQADLTAFGTTLDPNSSPFYLGKSYEHFKGLLDEVRIYNIVLPTALILEHAQRRY